MNKKVVFLISLFFLLLTIPLAAADDNITQENLWYVKAGSDDGDGSSSNPFNCLDSALNKANDNDTIIVNNGYYNGPHNNGLEISKNNLNIIGCENTVFTGQNYENFFKITGNNITVKGITFTEGYGGITVNKDASLKIMDSKFIENSGINGICIDNHGNLTVISSYFSNNTAIRDAGCISSLERSHTTIINSTFEFNSAGRNGGALKINDSYADIFNCSFINNTASGNDNYGGAVYHWTGITRIYNSSFINNTAGKCGGAVYTNGKNGYGIFESYNCEYLNNTSPEGGAIYIRSTGGQINYCGFINNTNTIYYENFKEKMDLNDNWWANNNPNFSNLINGQITIKNYTTVKLNMDSEAKVNTPVSINLIWNNAVFKRNAIFKSTGGDISGNIFTTNTSGKYVITAIVDNEILNTTVDAVQNAFLSLNDLDMYYKDGSRLIANLSDNFKKPIANAIVTFNINGGVYNRTTDNEGLAFLTVNLKANHYLVNVSYNGNFTYNPTEASGKINVKSTVLARDTVLMYQNGTDFIAEFLDNTGCALANSKVKFNINGVFYTRETDGKGVAKLGIKLRPDNYILTAYNPANSEERGFNITVKSLIAACDLTKYYLNASKFNVTLYNKDGSLAINKNVTFNINGIFYTRETDLNGSASLAINLRPGKYVITTIFDGLEIGKQVNVLPTLVTRNLTMDYLDGSRFTAQVLNGQGRPLANQNVSFNVNGVFYHKITGADGLASLNIRLMSGEYIITSIWNEFQTGNTIKVS